MEMAEALTILAVVLPMLLAAVFILGRQLARRAAQSDDLSPVTRQHIELFQGGQLNETALESAKRRLRRLLEHGQLDLLEASLRPGKRRVADSTAEIGRAHV